MVQLAVPSGVKNAWLWFTLPTLAWIVFIAWGSLAPPEELPSISFPLADKVEHALIYTILTFLLLRDWLRTRPGGWMLWLGALFIAAAYGLYLEFLQGLSGYRDFEISDAVANTVGAGLGVALWIILIRCPIVTKRLN